MAGDDQLELPLENTSRLPPLRPWGNPLAQGLWGEALVETGRKHRDPDLVREGREHERLAREAAVRKHTKG
jgi:hypothetical protein